MRQNNSLQVYYKERLVGTLAIPAVRNNAGLSWSYEIDKNTDKRSCRVYGEYI